MRACRRFQNIVRLCAHSGIFPAEPACAGASLPRRLQHPKNNPNAGWLAPDRTVYRCCASEPLDRLPPVPNFFAGALPL